MSAPYADRAVTEDSPLIDRVKHFSTERGYRIGRNNKSADMCVGGVLCKYLDMLNYINWADLNLTRPPEFPHTSTLSDVLFKLLRDEVIEENLLSGFWDSVYDTCDFYANSIVDANDEGAISDAWQVLGIFSDEFSL